jgi:PAS domain S-box-containing protein
VRWRLVSGAVTHGGVWLTVRSNSHKANARMKQLSRPPVRIGGILVLGVALELALSVPLGDWGAPYPAIAAAVGLLVAVAAGAAGGWWVGLVVGAVGWTLQFFLMADESVRALLALPAWLVAGAAAGWLAERLRAAADERDRLAAELAAVRDSASDAIVGIDGEGTIVTSGPGVEAMYGYSADEVEGRPLSLIAGEAGNGEAPDLMEAVRSGRRIQSARALHRRKDGSEVVAALTLTPIPSPEGGSDGALLVAENIGEQARVREQLGEAEAKYRSLAAQLPLVTYVYPLGKRVGALFVSPQVGTLLGYSAEEWLSEPELFERLLHSDDRERVLGEIAAAAERAEPLRTEYRLLARDGRVVWVRDESAIVRDSGGRALYVQGYLLDIGERRRAEDEKAALRAAERSAIAESRDRQRKLDFLAQACSVIASSPEYTVTLRRVAELAVRDLADWCFVDVVDDDGDPVRLVAANAEPDSPPSLEPKSQPEPEVLEVVGSGRPAVSANRICAPLLARGRVLGTLTFVLERRGRSYDADDVALVEGLATTAALAVDDARLYGKVEEEADAARVLTYVADGVFLLDRAGVVRLWNPAAEAITGIDEAAVVGQPAAQAIPGWESLSERIPVGEAAAPAAAATVPIETERGERWISISGVDFFGGTVFAFRDLTEVRRLEELKADFLATASHELRTPLAAVYGAAQTLLRHDFALDETGRKRFISLIVDESDRLGRIVNEILLANQLELGRVDLANEPFNAVELAEAVAETVRLHAPPGIRFEVEAAEPTVFLVADRDRVRQVLMNLVENAMKYSPDGGRVAIGVETVGTDVRYYVRDEGLGIPVDEHARIFDKFYRLDPGMTRGVGGTGLGLYICSELVERMDGRIWVDSAENVGSTFFVELPAGDSRHPRPLAPAARENSDQS